MTATVEERCHFSIDGETFTQLVRARMRDDNPGAAFRLASGLIGADASATADVAIRLCKGEVALAGSGTLDVVEVPDTEYMAQLRWLFAGRTRIQGGWYRPVAYVSNVGPNDLRNWRGRPVTTNNYSGRSAYDGRGWHYAGEAEIVVEDVTFRDCDGLAREVIFERCGERPHWDAAVGPQAALEEFLAAGRKLQERSHSLWYPAEREEVQEPVATLRREDAAAREARHAVEDAAREARYAAEDAARAQLVIDLRERILRQADGDLLELAWPEKRSDNDPATIVDPGGSAMIPRAPFVIWATHPNQRLWKKRPAWAVVSPSGLKMQCDDPYHTDWVIGGGFDPGDRRFYWGGPLAEAALALRGRIVDELRGDGQVADAIVLSAGPAAAGPVIHGIRDRTVKPGSIVVLPNLRPHYLACCKHAAAVITEAGGQTAHLAQVGREQGLLILLVAGARELFPEGSVVEVDGAAATARLCGEDPDA